MQARNVPDAYNEVWWKMGEGIEKTRNGTVKSMPGPFVLTILNPRQRVLFDRKRDCNHFFHLAETVWMLAGSDDVRFLEDYNKGYRAFAEPNSDVIWGAYGKRWMWNWSEDNQGYRQMDQIQAVIYLLKREPTTRRAVIAMWDSWQDVETDRNDLPCNTHIYFRIVNGELDMTVCNRSNDLVWGMLGANAVHMTYLHELVAHQIRYPIGRYHVMTNNLHVYEKHWDLKPAGAYDYYQNIPAQDEGEPIEPYPLLQPEETWEMLHNDCKHLTEDGGQANLKTEWAANVVWPLLKAYTARKFGGTGLDWIKTCKATDWQLACEMYVENKS
jgi:thymidylate synthase